jgi:hypothetical protein
MARSPVIEAHHELGLKIDSPRPTNHNPHEISAVYRRHEINNGRTAGLGVELGFKDEGAGTIAPIGAERRTLWSDEPAPVIGVPE